MTLFLCALDSRQRRCRTFLVKILTFELFYFDRNLDNFLYILLWVLLKVNLDLNSDISFIILNSWNMVVVFHFKGFLYLGLKQVSHFSSICNYIRVILLSVLSWSETVVPLLISHFAKLRILKWLLFPVKLLFIIELKSTSIFW